MTGRVIKYADNVSTDAIIAGKYTKTLDFQELAAHAMEDLDPHFHEKLTQRNIIAAGHYFGCGSSREQAPIALRTAGVACILAKDFSRIFFRNAINVGLCIAECDTDLIDDGDEITYVPGDGKVVNHTKSMEIPVLGLPQIMVDILEAGGLQPYLKSRNGSMEE
ncbi:MAG: 3-isopropylmalate dehydratase [Firmicutes bacterium]|nr:3-isopropylmalate dehydratase [Bacillota bacterium]